MNIFTTIDVQIPIFLANSPGLKKALPKNGGVILKINILFFLLYFLVILCARIILSFFTGMAKSDGNDDQ